MNPPNYRAGTARQHCGNCGAFRRYGTWKVGWCKMYRTLVDRQKTCDRWYPR